MKVVGLFGAAMPSEVVRALENRMSGVGADRVRLAQLGAEVGHALALGYLTSAEAARLGRVAARQRRVPDEHVMGYWKAIADLLGALAAALQDVEERGSLEREVENRPAWKKVLLALHDRPHSPSELARLVEPSLTKDDGRMSRQLGDMEEAGLVEAAITMGDGRVRARQLTPRGHRIAGAIRPATAPAISSGGEIRSPAGGEVAVGSIVGAVVAMLSLIQRSGAANVELRELAACSGVVLHDRDQLARKVTELGELHGMLDLTAEGHVAWGRGSQQEAWRTLLKKCGKRRLERAFEPVPDGFLFCVDADIVDDFRAALDAGRVRAKDVCTPVQARKMFADFPATVVIDRTIVAALTAEVPGIRPPIYLAEPRGPRDLAVALEA